MAAKLSLIIPAYNEEKRIGRTLGEYAGYFGKIGMIYEIIVIMDGCTDGTPGIVAEHASRNMNIRYKNHRAKQGKGGALLLGFGMARGEFISYADADGSTPPGEILRLVRSIGNYDGVIGSRWMKGSVLTRKQRPVRRIASRGFNLMTRFFLGLPFRDTQCPAKVFRAKVIKDVSKMLGVTNFAFDACLLFLVKECGYRIREVPIRWEDKAMSSVKISRAIPTMFMTVLKMRLGGIKSGKRGKPGS